MSSEHGLLREIVMSLVLPLIKLCRTYEYTVKEVSEDGRLDLAPTKSKIAPKLTGVRQWAGAGTRAIPRRGSTVAVQFLDGDPARPVITSFTPLGTQVGQPAKIEIDAGDLVAIGAGADAVELASGSDMLASGDEVGRVVRYGDLVSITVTGAAAVGAIMQQPPGGNPISKVRA